MSKQYTDGDLSYEGTLSSHIRTSDHMESRTIRFHEAVVCNAMSLNHFQTRMSRINEVDLAIACSDVRLHISI